MKKIILGFVLAVAVFNGFSQESMVTLSGGYAFATIKNYDDPATGYRINGLYEFNPSGGKLAHGLAFGYANITATSDKTTQLKTTVSSVPIYYAPKLMFGGEKAKVFVKGAIGMQFATLKKEVLNFTDHDAGFYGGGGAGGMLFLTESLFLNAEYEIAWVSNSFYGDGWLNSAMAGIGIKF